MRRLRWLSVLLILTACAGYEYPCSGVTVSANRFHDCARTGAIVSSATTRVEGNMFAPECPFIVQNEPAFSAVSGADSLFAERPEIPFGVVTIDDMALME
jgi:hypothetical protein